MIGDGNPIVVQSMCATKTTDVEATAAQANELAKAGAGVVRIAVDTARDADKALLAKASMAEAMGLEVAICGTRKNGKGWT